MSTVAQEAEAAAAPIDLGVIRWIGFKTIVIREYGRIIRIWGKQIRSLRGNSRRLYFVIFGSLIVAVACRKPVDSFRLHAVHRPRPHHAGCNHQLLRECGLVLFRREVRQTSGGVAGLSITELGDRVRLCDRRCRARVAGGRGRNSSCLLLSPRALCTSSMCW